MVWKSATHRDDKGWYAEFEIPYSALRFPKSEVQDWSVNIVRHIRRYRASYAWNPIDITNENISSQAGTVKGFKNIEGVIRGKSELFDFILKNGGKVFINNKDKVLKNFIKRFSDPIEVHGENSFCKIKLLESEPNIIFSDSNDNEYTTNLFGEYNFENIMMALSVSKFLGIEEEISANIISKYYPEDNRSQKFSFSSNCIVLDAYNANPVSMVNAIESVSKFSNKNKVMILGDMNELGKFMELEHRNIGKITSRLNLEACYFVGNKMKFAHEENKLSLWFKNLSDLEDELTEKKFKDTDILVKGSRSLELENIVHILKKISV